MSETELSRLLRQAKRSEPAPPAFASVLARKPARHRPRAAPGFAALAAGLAVAVFVAAPRQPPDASPPVETAEPTPPLSTDWLAEPMSADLLSTVPILTVTGDDYADF